MSYKDERREQMKSKILASIIMYTMYMGYPPTVDEIGQMVGLSSKATVSYYLGMLKAEGKVDWEAGKPRTIRVIGEDNG